MTKIDMNGRRFLTATALGAGAQCVCERELHRRVGGGGEARPGRAVGIEAVSVKIDNFHLAPARFHPAIKHARVGWNAGDAPSPNDSFAQDRAEVAKLNKHCPRAPISST